MLLLFLFSFGVLLCLNKNLPYGSGPLSSVWKEWVKWCIEFGIEANSIIAAPYDWRLSPSKLEERDLYFHKLKFVFFFINILTCAIVTYHLSLIGYLCVY